ncbi:MAG: PorV/PorQ family protein, partial [Candidatus Eisenbacteria bacterium]|nr:PorV/PorQ family protein [Candidatus Eisenbacteria bacterium]
MHRIRHFCAALLLLAGAAHAGIDNAGTTSANFLSVGAGASVLSMGGAAIGTGGSLTASAWNPAALGLVAGPQYSISHAALAMQTSQDWVAAGGRLRNGTTRWSLNAIYENDGDFEGRDQFGASTGTFNASNLAIGAAFARPFGNVFVAGAGVKWVNEYLGDVTGTGIGFDLGVQARAGAFGVGAAARNVGGKMSFESGDFDMPSVFGVGASWADPVRGLRLNLDANFPSAYYNDVRLGGEWMWQNRVAVRAGYRMELNAPKGEPLGGPSFGVGGGSNSVWVDYGFLAGESEAQGAHRLSFSLHPGFMNPGGLAMAPTPIRAAEPALANGAPAKPAEQPVAIVREPAKPAAVPTPVVAPVAIVREPVKPAPVVAPVVAPVAIVREPAKPAAPILAIVREPSAPAPIAAPVVPAVRIEPPADAMAAQVAPRATPASSAALRTGKPVRVPKLIVPKPEPVAVAKPAPAVAAPVAVAAPAAPRPAVQLASSAPSTTVVPPSAPSTEPIARPAPVVTAEAAPAPVVQPAPVAPAAQPAPPAPVR